ncbi:MAG TPA: hypothetical protein VGL19_20105 [Polyangiaceae bacterium]
MSTAYDEAVKALYQAPHESFVAERQRLSAELKANDDRAGAARLAKLGRPTVSAWAVNQLWWHAREAFEELFETAAELRKGKLSASAGHRKVLAQLSARAQKLLSAGGHAVSEGTLRRVSMTLSGLAAVGSFEPEQPGTLSKDRDPPGFEAFGGANFGEHAGPAPKPPSKHEPSKAKAAIEAQKAHEIAEKQRQREAEARAKKDAERSKRKATLREAKAELSTKERERELAEKALTAATREAERARAGVDAAEAKLAALDDED